MADLDKFFPIKLEKPSENFDVKNQEEMEALQKREEEKMQESQRNSNGTVEKRIADLGYITLDKFIKVMPKIEGVDNQVELQAIEICVPLNKQLGNLYRIVTVSQGKERKLFAISPPINVSLGEKFRFNKMAKDYNKFLQGRFVDGHDYARVSPFDETMEYNFNIFLNYVIGSLKVEEDNDLYRNNFKNIEEIMKNGGVFKIGEMVDPEEFKTLAEQALADLRGMQGDPVYKPSILVSPRDFVEIFNNILKPVLKEKNN